MSKKLLFNFNREVIQNYTYVKYVGTIITATNTLEKPIKSATSKGSTKYRDIDTGEFLETFEEGRNLELVSVKMPVLTTSNEDGTKTNILTVNEEVTLRGIGDVKDTLDLTTTELTQRIGEVVLDGSENYIVWHENRLSEGMSGIYTLNADVDMGENKKGVISCDNLPISHIENLKTTTNNSIIKGGGYIGVIMKATSSDEIKQWLSENPITVQYKKATEQIKTVDLSILDQSGNKVSSISSFNDTTHITASSETIPPIFEGYLATKEG